MQEVFLRFPHLSEIIFDSLDNKSLANSKEVSKSWYFYLDTQKFQQPRIIKANIKKVEEAVDIVRNIFQFFHPLGEFQNKKNSRPLFTIILSQKCQFQDSRF